MGYLDWKYGERIWFDESNCDSDGMPSECFDAAVTHWAVSPEIVLNAQVEKR